MTFKCTSIGLLLCLLAITNHAQLLNSPEAYGLNNITAIGEYGSGCSFVDFDRDGWDDLTTCSIGGLKLFKNIDGITFQELDLEFPGLPAIDFNCVQWIDFDNDHDLDLFLTAYNNEIFLYEQTAPMLFVDAGENYGLVNGSTFHYGASWGDLNNDGLLDLYLCVYSNWAFDNPSRYNRLFIQQSEGGFEEMAAEYGVTDGNKPSFQSIFWDYDNDGWQDLLIINDRTPIFNSMYRNVNGEYFEDVSIESGFYENFSPMSIGIGDYNNNGKFDIYMANTPDGNKFYVPDEENVYHDVALELGLEVYSFCWASVWLDFDNDGFEDLYVDASPNFPEQGFDFLFRNDGMGGFNLANDLILDGGQTDSHCAVQSDFNQDGFPDLFVYPQADQPKLFVNQAEEGAGNNWVSIELEGTYSNFDAFGSTIRVYCGEDQLNRIVLSGEGFIAQHSKKEHVGLGQHEVIDSLRITWPRGLVETYYNLDVDQFYKFVEGATIVPELNSGDITLCPNGSYEALVSGSYEEVIWSTGEEGSSILISEPGIYSATVIHSSGLSFQTDTLTISLAPQMEIEFTTQDPSCNDYENGSIYFSNSNLNYTSIEWFNFGNSDSLSGLDAGNYFYQGMDEFGCPFFGSTTLSEPDELILSLSSSQVLENDSCAYTHTVQIEIEGGTPDYDISWDLIGTMNNNTTFDEESQSIRCIDYGFLMVNVNDAQGCTGYAEMELELLLSQSELNSKSSIQTVGNGTVYYSGLDQVESVIIWNSRGQMISKINAPLPGFEIPSNIPGIYLIDFQKSDKSIRSKYLLITE